MTEDSAREIVSGSETISRDTEAVIARFSHSSGDEKEKENSESKTLLLDKLADEWSDDESIEKVDESADQMDDKTGEKLEDKSSEKSPC